MKKFVAFSLFLFCGITLNAHEYHVAVRGNDSGSGSEKTPLRTISAAARLARAGDTVTVHEGTYREWIKPTFGGLSDSQRIVYRAAPGESVEIKGSEIIRDWQPVGNGVWKVILPNSFFEDYNPYQDVIWGDWFVDKGRKHHTGEVYLNGKSFYEVDSLAKVMEPKPLPLAVDSLGSTYAWYCESNDSTTTIWANFHQYKPNKELVEINVRPSCFYPEQNGVNYITISGFHFSQAATQWAPPTAEQIGLIGTNWSKGWIIENNRIHDSKCTGITLGKERGTGHNVWVLDPAKDGSVHYIEVIFRAREIGWEKESVGSHIVRNNTIYNCEQTGICGSLGAIFSQIIGNHIYNIWQKRQFDGPEIAAVKIHGAIDMLIANNRIHNATMGFFMDWMTQGTRISSNLMYDNDVLDIYMEVDQGPYLADNNLLLSQLGVMSMSQGGAFVHNLIAGRVKTMSDNRFTPYFFPHSTHVAGLANLYAGDDRWYNNIFTATTTVESPALKARGVFAEGTYGLEIYDNGKIGLPVYMANNAYLNDAKPYSKEQNPAVDATTDSQIEIREEGDRVFLQIAPGTACADATGALITTALLGKARIPNLDFENPDGTPLRIDTDYLGMARSADSPATGPFENLKSEKQIIRVW